MMKEETITASKPLPGTLAEIAVPRTTGHDREFWRKLSLPHAS